MDALNTYILHFSEASIGDLRLGPHGTRRSVWAWRRRSRRGSPAEVIVLPVGGPETDMELPYSA